MADLLEVIKQISDNTTKAGVPMAVMFGTVTSADPLEVNIEQRLTLNDRFLVLTDAVKSHDVVFTTPDGDVLYKEHRTLNVGDTVVLLRMPGGQKFIVMDRVWSS